MEKICRVCGVESNFIDLSHPNNQCYVNKFISCANVSFEIDDKLPKTICHQCKNDLEMSYSFKEKCEQSQQKFLQIISDIEIEASQKIQSNLKIETNVNDLNDKFPTDIDDKPFNENNIETETNFQEITALFVEEDYDEVIDFKIEATNVQEMDDIFEKESVGNYDNCNSNFAMLRKSSKINRNTDRNAKIINKSKFTCDICNGKFRKKFNLELHMRRYHNMAKNLCECEYCGKFIIGKKFTIHIYSHEKPFKCEACSYSFTTNANLTRHIRNIHENPKIPKVNSIIMVQKKESHKIKKDNAENMNMLTTLKCDYCPKKIFMDENELKQHQSVKQFDFNCDKCCKSYKNVKSLNNHKLDHLSIAERQLYIAKKRIENQKIRFAAKEKSEEKPKKIQQIVRICQICGKIYTTSSNFFAHMISHSNKKPFKCGYCDKVFKVSTHCRLHERMHTGEKPYKCNTCDMCFRQLPHLIRHKRTHTGEKPFKCDLCSKTFAQAGNRTKHMRVHTGEKPYKCDYCGENFFENNILTKHILKYHS